MKAEEYAAAIRAGDDPKAIITLAQQEARAAALGDAVRVCDGEVAMLRIEGEYGDVIAGVQRCITKIRALLEGK